MVFIESPIFTADVKKLVSDEEYGVLQDHLAQRPDSGDVIGQTGGLRKVRWRVQGGGKGGGVRVIYYHVAAQVQIRMILIYQKGGFTHVECGVVTLDKKLFKRLVESMEQNEEIRRGERVPSREFFVDAENVKEIRAMTGLSQPKFARLLDVDVGTLRNWEQGRRQPTGPARALLRAIKHDPKSVLKALAA